MKEATSQPFERRVSAHQQLFRRHSVTMKKPASQRESEELVKNGKEDPSRVRGSCKRRSITSY